MKSPTTFPSAPPEHGLVRPASALYPAAPIVAGLLLILAATFKLYPLLAGFAVWQRGTAALAVAEALLGLWLMSTVAARAARLVAVALFAVFLAVTISRGLAGSRSCGCYGPLRVNPWLSAVVDVAVLAALLAARPGPARGRWLARLWLVPAALGCVFAGIATTQALESSAGGMLHADGTITGNPAVVRYDAPQWYGHRLPFMAFIPHHGPLQKGSWSLLLYRHNCVACQLAVRRFAAPGVHHARRRALLEIPPLGPLPASVKTHHLPHFHLTTTHGWFGIAPLEIQLKNGVVTAVREPAGG